MSDDCATRDNNDQIKRRREEDVNTLFKKRAKDSDQNDRAKENSNDIKDDIEKNCKEDARHRREAKFTKEYIDSAILKMSIEKR